jgi:hypothetical protein
MMRKMVKNVVPNFQPLQWMPKTCGSELVAGGAEVDLGVVGSGSYYE